MELADVKDRLKAIEDALDDAPFVLFHTFERGARPVHLALTARLRKHARKDGVCATATPVVAGWRPMAAITIAAVHIRANRVSRRLTGPPYFNDPANRHKSPRSGHLSVLVA